MTNQREAQPSAAEGMGGCGPTPIESVLRHAEERAVHLLLAGLEVSSIGELKALVDEARDRRPPRVEDVGIESEEDGWRLILDTTEHGRFEFCVHGVAMRLRRETDQIAEWWREGLGAR